MKSPVNQAQPRQSHQWQPCFPSHAYDCHPALRTREQRALDYFAGQSRRGGRRWTNDVETQLARVLQPIRDVVAYCGSSYIPKGILCFTSILLEEMQSRRTSLWAWTTQEWLEIINRGGAHRYRQLVLATAYLLGGFRNLTAVPCYWRYDLAARVFGRAPVDSVLERIRQERVRWGYSQITDRAFQHAVCELLLVNGSPLLEDLTSESVQAYYDQCRSRALRSHLTGISVVLAGLGILPRPLTNPGYRIDLRAPYPAAEEGVAAEWLTFVQRWLNTTTLVDAHRHGYYRLVKVGRWLAQCHPERSDPATWTPEFAVECVAAVARLRVGDYATVYPGQAVDLRLILVHPHFP
jgi:hypothetical protein